MEVKTLYEDDTVVVKVATNRGQHLYTRTYILDEDGYAEKSIIVFYDGRIQVE